ncbi:hypothetical protein FPQ18DRAFT_302190 [Pyronema domesticum]|nr:hypothetical protein FPQ18DRAFT_302190 [Pyronema domesticum]
MSYPLSVSASVVGILGFTAQIIKLLDDYVSSVKSAPEEAQSLRNDIAAIHYVLTQLTTFLNTAIDGIKNKFTDGCVLSLAIEECNRKITSIYMKVGKLAN